MIVNKSNFFKNSQELLSRPQSNIFSAAFVIAITYGLSMVLGIVRERILISKFYACCSQQLDVYYAAFRIPDMIFQLIVIGALSAAFIPVFSEYLAKDEEQANKVASSLINLLFVFFIGFSLLIFIFARPFSARITGNFLPWQVDLMAQITKTMLLAQIFFLISNFFSAIIQSKQRFLIPSLSPVAYNVGIITTVLLLSKSLGIWSATLGVLIGSFLHLLIQVPLLKKLNFKFEFSFDWQHPGVRKVLKLMLPRTLSLATSQLEATISLFLATSLSAGSLTIYYLAQRLVDLPVRLLGTSVGQAALPILSLQYSEKKYEQFKKTILESINQIFFLALPATAFFLVFRVQLVRFAYGAKSFPWEATIVTGRAIAAISFSIFSQSAIQLLVRGFYALHDTTTPFWISLASVILNIILSVTLVLIVNWGIFGLALAFSISNFVNFLLLFLFFNLKKENILDRQVVASWLKMAVSSIIAAFFSWSAMKLLDKYVFVTTKTLPLLVLCFLSGGIGLGVYFWLSKLFGLEELKIIGKLLRKVGAWRNTLFSVEEIIEPHSGTGSGS